MGLVDSIKNITKALLGNDATGLSPDDKKIYEQVLKADKPEVREAMIKDLQSSSNTPKGGMGKKNVPVVPQPVKDDAVKPNEKKTREPEDRERE